MDNSLLKTLTDILNSIHEIDSFFELYPRRFDAFCENTILRRAILMNIAIIGEATNRILKNNPEVAITNARKIVDTRNYVIHGYDSLRPEMIWAIVINHLPLLEKEASELLNKLKES